MVKIYCGYLVCVVRLLNLSTKLCKLKSYVICKVSSLYTICVLSEVSLYLTVLFIIKYTILNILNPLLYVRYPNKNLWLFYRVQ